MNKKNKFIFHNYLATFFLFSLMGIYPAFALISIYIKIVIVAIMGCFWLAFYFRIVYIYDDSIEFFFPFRFKPLYKKRRTIFRYEEIKEVRIISGHGYSSTKIKFVLNKKRYYLWKYTNDSFGIMPDERDSKVKKFLNFLKQENVIVVFKVDENKRYLFEPDE